MTTVLPANWLGLVTTTPMCAKDSPWRVTLSVGPSMRPSNSGKAENGPLMSVGGAHVEHPAINEKNTR